MVLRSPKALLHPTRSTMPEYQPQREQDEKANQIGVGDHQSDGQPGAGERLYLEQLRAQRHRLFGDGVEHCEDAPHTDWSLAACRNRMIRTTTANWNSGNRTMARIGAAISLIKPMWSLPIYSQRPSAAGLCE